MITNNSIADYLLTSFFAGVAGIIAMEAVMWRIGQAQWAKGSMIIALGALITRRRENAFRTGLVLHVISATLFALLYTLAMDNLGLAQWPTALFVGTGFGVFHGIIVSLALVWIVAEQHPLEEFNEAGLAVGLIHFAGHVAYGAAVGLVIAVTARI